MPDAISSIIDSLRQLASRFGLNLNFDGGSGSGGFSLMGFLRQITDGILGLFGTLIFTIAGVVAAIFLAIYLAARPAPVVDWVIRLFPTDRRPRVKEILSFLAIPIVIVAGVLVEELWFRRLEESSEEQERPE